MKRKPQGGVPMRRSELRPSRDEVERFYDEMQLEMRRYAAHIVGPDDAEDVAQDALVKFFDQRERTRERSSQRASERTRSRLPRQATMGSAPERDDPAHATPVGRDARLRLLRMVRDTAIDRCRQVVREARLLQLVTGPGAAARRWSSTRRRAEDSEIRRTVHAALEEMPRYLRDPWILARENGMEVHEAAAQLGIPAATCRVYLMRANERLERQLREMGLTPRTIRGKEVE